MITSVNRMKVYETDGKEVEPASDLELEVHSHWNRDEMVVLHLPLGPDGREITVLRRDLEAAIHNACNTARF